MEFYEKLLNMKINFCKEKVINEFFHINEFI